MRKALVLPTVILTLAVIAAYKGRLELRHPELFFRYTCALSNLHVSSDEPIPLPEATQLLERVAEKLQTSPLYEPKDQHHAFICNAPWRQNHYLGDSAGGMNYYPTIGQSFVFLRSARWADNRLLSPKGLAIGGKRTLDYYITHEFTHSLVFRNSKQQIPHWLDEGYCDWIGLGRQSSYYAALKDYREADPAATDASALDYLKYDVLVAYLLDERKRDIRELLHSPPDQQEVEREALGGRPKS